MGKWIFNRTTLSIVGYCGDISREVVIPNKICNMDVKHIRDYALCNKGIESIVVPDGIVSMGSHAFFGNKIRSLVLPKSLKSVGRYCFAYNHLESVNILCDDCDLGIGSFYKNSIRSLEIIGKINVGIGAFADNCISKMSFDNIAEIGEYAFTNNKLKNIKLSESVRYIAQTSFINCDIDLCSVVNNIMEIQKYL